MAKVKTSRTEEFTYDGEVLVTPMNALSEVLKLPSYVMENSTSIYDAKTQEPLIDIVKSGAYLPSDLMTYSGGRLLKAHLLCVQSLTDDQILVIVLETIADELDPRHTDRFIAYLIYDL